MKQTYANYYKEYRLRNLDKIRLYNRMYYLRKRGFTGDMENVEEWLRNSRVMGGKAAARTNTAKYGPDYYKRIGAIGGAKGKTGGFYANRELAREAGRKGGQISRRRKKEE